MYCERYRCEMSVDVCLARQKKAAAGHAGKIVNFAIMHGSIDPGCIHCAQGKEIQKMGGDTERKCRKCGDTKPIKQFRLNKQCSGGREWTCRACRKITDDERTAARKLAAGEAAEAIAIPAAMTPAGVEPIEPAEIGIPIAGDAPAPPETETSPNNLKIVNAMDARCFEDFIETKTGCSIAKAGAWNGS